MRLEELTKVIRIARPGEILPSFLHFQRHGGKYLDLKMKKMWQLTLPSINSYSNHHGCSYQDVLPDVRI